jgi:hypothetical protein
LREETGLEVDVGPLLGVCPLEAAPGQWVDIVAFAGELDDPTATPMVSEEHSEVAFCDPIAVRLAAPYRELVRRAR